MGTTEQVARYVTEESYDRLDAEVVEKVKWILLDSLACGLGGRQTPIGNILVKLSRDLGGNPEATIIGDRARANCLIAGYVNSALIDALDFEETLVSHPAATVVPAALSIGERVAASGKEFVAAIVTGYEVSVRIARATRPTPERAEKMASMFHFQAFGAVAAAGKLLRLDDKSMASALGCAAANSPLPIWVSRWPRPLHWTKNNFAGQTAAGILAALTAKEGWVGPNGILDHDIGFWRMVGSDRYVRDRVTEGLGETYEILADTAKYFPCCRFTHTTLEALERITKRKPLSTSQIARVVVKTCRHLAESFSDYTPATFVDAEFSIPYTVALLLSGREPGPSWYEEGVLADQSIRELASKVCVRVDRGAEAVYRESGKYVSTVEISTIDGKTFVESVEDASPGWDEQKLYRKFQSLAVPLIGDKEARRLYDLVRNIEELTDVRVLTDVLVPGDESVQRQGD